MPYELRPGDGSLFKNDRKEKETHPDMTGKAMTPDGVKVWLSAWRKTTKAGDAFLSIAMKPMEEKASPKVDDDDNPF